MMKKVILLMCVLIASIGSNAQSKSTAFNAQNLQVKWDVLQNNYNGKPQFKSVLSFTNTDKQAMPANGWKVYFNFARQIVPESVEGPVKIEHLNGDFFCMSPNPNFHGLSTNATMRVAFVAGAWVVNFTDAPEGFYYVADNAPDVTVSIKNISQVPSTKPEQLQRTPADKVDVVTPQYVYKQNDQIQNIPESELSGIFPTPVNYKKGGQPFVLTAHTQVIADAAFTNESAYLKQQMANLFIGAAVHSKLTARQNISLQKKVGLGQEEYELQVNANHITIAASTGAGIFYGIQSLKSLLPAKAWQGKMQSIPIRAVIVKDKPRFGYRGLMLDVARNFQPKSQILKVIDLMSMYKLNTLHMHLNDDEGWRLEIPSLPELTSVGSKRGHTLTNTDHLQPSYGSGPDVNNNYGSGNYSKADFVEILRYANIRHITIIPEIESPGHARAAIKSMDARYKRLMKAGQQAEAERYLLHDLQDQSVYSSVQHWSDNVMDVAIPSTYNFLETLVDEIVNMYREAGAPLKTIHFGGDEVPAGVWAKSPSVQKLLAGSSDVKTTDDLWYYYFKKINQLLKSRNLYVSGWEEAGLRKVMVNGVKKQVPNTDFAQANFHLYVWNNVLGWGAEDLAYQLANAGYPVILSCVSNLYFDLSYQKNFYEPGQYWGGYVDVDKPFKFIPYNYLKNITENSMGVPVPASAWAKKEKLTETGKAHIVGIQGQLWSEEAKGVDRMEYLLLPKMLGLAERAWAKDPDWATELDSAKANTLYNTAWSTFCNTLGKKELVKLSYMHQGFQYRIPTAGVVIENGTVKANVQFPGMTIRYTTNQAEPIISSTMYTGPLTQKGTYKFRVFDDAGRGGRVVTVTN
ncbi:family 20 glycosylhydrolase [Mucilaginibacter robiniae]|uniref:beta-N-acetylhexosaminidase n=1 Tax=Mucilaginibacter robiniae TaxID=2728022 RepID=A0A7L5E4Y3_9SPHI|nr:family 20 glycosylhydrolase [Mucilaginibacter robiniae]QJD97678.1 family 20 glycosylhydrolase [Mucilaginibacter robiniae]